jgi:hypothetical protein
MADRRHPVQHPGARLNRPRRLARASPTLTQRNQRRRHGDSGSPIISADDRSAAAAPMRRHSNSALAPSLSGVSSSQHERAHRPDLPVPRLSAATATGTATPSRSSGPTGPCTGWPTCSPIPSVTKLPCCRARVTKPPGAGSAAPRLPAHRLAGRTAAINDDRHQVIVYAPRLPVARYPECRPPGGTAPCEAGDRGVARRTRRNTPARTDLGHSQNIRTAKPRNHETTLSM